MRAMISRLPPKLCQRAFKYFSFCLSGRTAPSISAFQAPLDTTSVAMLPYRLEDIGCGEPDARGGEPADPSCRRTDLLVVLLGEVDT